MVLGEEESVLFREVSLFQAVVLIEGFHCIHGGAAKLSAFRDKFVWAIVRWGPHRCPLYRVRRCPLLNIMRSSISNCRL